MIKKQNKGFLEHTNAADDRTTILSDTVRVAELQRARDLIQASPCLLLTLKSQQEGRRASDAASDIALEEIQDLTQTTKTQSQQGGHLWILEKPQLVLGRSPDTDIYIDDPSVSKKHAIFKVENNKVYVIDLDSTNKTKINEQSISAQEVMPLVNNDELHIGRVMFKFFAHGTIEARMAREDFKRAHIDPLTKIFNRRYLNTLAGNLFQRSQLLHHNLSLMVFDIDFFKKINDTYGHEAGDFVLKKLASLVNGTLVRNNDICARYGGEEFVLLFQQPLEQAVDIAWRINKLIASTEFNYRGTKINVRISAGLTGRHTQDEGWADMFRRADELLYQAKNKGRNQVVADINKKQAA